MRQFLLGFGRRLGAFSQRMFGRHLLLANAAISTAMGLAGDGVQQNYEVACGFQDHFQSRRSMHMGAAGLTTGVVTHYWYNLLDRWWQGRAAKIILIKVLYDQILFSPVCLTVYFGTVALLERSDLNEFKEELTDKGGTVYLVEWMVWPLAQTFNFYYLPLRYRVMFDTVISFGFDVFTPYIKYRDQRQLDKHNPVEDVPKNAGVAREENNLKSGSSIMMALSDRLKTNGQSIPRSSKSVDENTLRIS